MSKKQDIRLPKYSIKDKSGFFPSSWDLEGSQAYNELRESSKKILKYYWCRLVWKGKKNKAKPINNGKLSIPSIALMRDLALSKQSVSNGIKQLVEVGFFKITRYGGARESHLVKILYWVVIKNEERWRLYPTKSWEDEVPQAKGNLVGAKTRWRKGQSGREVNSHPKELDQDKSRELDQEDSLSLKAYTDRVGNN